MCPVRTTPVNRWNQAITANAFSTGIGVPRTLTHCAKIWFLRDTEASLTPILVQWARWHWVKQFADSSWTLTCSMPNRS